MRFPLLAAINAVGWPGRQATCATSVARLGVEGKRAWRVGFIHDGWCAGVRVRPGGVAALQTAARRTGPSRPDRHEHPRRDSWNSLFTPDTTGEVSRRATCDVCSSFAQRRPDASTNQNGDARRSDHDALSHGATVTNASSPILSSYAAGGRSLLGRSAFSSGLREASRSAVGFRCRPSSVGAPSVHVMVGKRESAMETRFWLCEPDRDPQCTRHTGTRGRRYPRRPPAGR
jgi:hypothetical protein